MALEPPALAHFAQPFLHVDVYCGSTTSYMFADTSETAHAAARVAILSAVVEYKMTKDSENGAVNSENVCSLALQFGSLAGFIWQTRIPRRLHVILCVDTCRRRLR